MADGWSYSLEHRGSTLAVSEGEATVGRSRSCDICLDDPSISRRHARLESRFGRMVVHDLESSNGTFVNGRRVERAELEDGDTLTLGEAAVVVRMVAPEAGFETVRLTEEGGGARLPGEATSFLQRASVELAQRTLGEEEGADDEGGSVVWSEDPASDDSADEGTAEVEPVPVPAAPAPPPPPVAPAAVAESAPAAAVAADGGDGELLPPLDDLDALAAASPDAIAPAGPAPSGWRPAGFWLRLAAAFLDGLWITALGAVTWWVAGESFAGLVAGVTGAAVVLGGWAVWGTTPGKRLLGLYVLTPEGRPGIGLGRALLRYLGYLVDVMTLGVGFLLVGLSASKRGLHDRIAGTYVGRR